MQKKMEHDLEYILSKYPLKQEYYYLKDLGHSETAIEQFHEKNINAFWGQSFESAATIIEAVIEEEGIDAAVKKFHVMQSDNKSKYVFIENHFNALGYRLMNQKKLKEAIEIFKINVEMYPDSWNAYDSLGEAYMKDNQLKLAALNYQKSLALNSQNGNAQEMLKLINKK